MDSTIQFISVSDDSGEAVEDKNTRFESLRQEIRQWKKLLDESKVPKNAGADNDLIQNIATDYEKYLTADQLQYVRSAVDYKKWLHESTEFRKHVAYYLSMRKYNNMLRADFEQDVRAQVEAVAADEFMEHFALNQCPL